MREGIIINNSIVIIFLFAFLYWMIISEQNKKILDIIRNKRKGMCIQMPVEMIKEFIGKDCIISLFSGAVAGKIVEVEGNWLKVEEKKKTRIVNGDMIKDISIINR